MMKINVRVVRWFLSSICAIISEGFIVRGPAMPLLVQLGASVTLPCSVDTPLPLHTLEVEWKREDSGTLVHLFQEGESRPESQSPPYSDRAEFFAEEISKGNYSLLLSNVTTEDKGLYVCIVYSEHESNETKVKIDTERLVVTGADGPIFAYAGEDVILNCSVDTHIPLRELEVEWMKTNGEILVRLFSEGQIISESQHERFTGRAEFFSEEIPKGNFSLKLRDVKTEDRGEFMCKVHTDRESVNATAWLQDQGFSTLHIWVLVLSTAAAVFAVLSCIPAVWSIKKQKEIKEDERNRAVLLHFLRVSIPCIMVSIAFAIWGKIESSFGEAYVCSTLNLMRILVIFKVAPYERLGKCYEQLTNLALPLEITVIAAGMNSDILQRYLTDHAPEDLRKIFILLGFGLILLFGLGAVCFSAIRSVPVCTRLFEPSDFSFVFLQLNAAICFEIGFLWNTRDLSLFLLWPFLGITVVPLGVLMLYLCQSRIFRLRYGYLCQNILVVLCFIIEMISSLKVIDTIPENNKWRPVLMCFCVFLYILTATTFFQHRSDIPAVPHILVYVFGSAGLSVLNSVTLATEVFLKTEKGERTVEDLQVIILPLESLFLACWLGLQVYAYSTQEEKIREQRRLIFQSCKNQGLSPTSPQQDQTPEEVEELVHLSPPAQSTTHREKVFSMSNR